MISSSATATTARTVESSQFESDVFVTKLRNKTWDNTQKTQKKYRKVFGCVMIWIAISVPMKK